MSTNQKKLIASKRVIANNNLPTRLPLWSTATWFLLMERFNAPQWLWGSLGFFFLLAWGAAIYGVVTEEKVDLLKSDEK